MKYEKLERYGEVMDKYETLATVFVVLASFTAMFYAGAIMANTFDAVVDIVVLFLVFAMFTISLVASGKIIKIEKMSDDYILKEVLNIVKNSGANSYKIMNKNHYYVVLLKEEYLVDDKLKQKVNNELSAMRRSIGRSKVDVSMCGETYFFGLGISDDYKEVQV